MREERYGELCEAIRSGSHVRALETYADVINEVVEHIVSAKMPDNPKCMLKSISVQQDVLNRAEAFFEVLKKESFDAENLVARLDELCGALRRYDALLGAMCGPVGTDTPEHEL